MANTQQEQGSVSNRRFLGLHTTTKGPTAPQGTAEDVVNIDFQYESIRGRAPTKKMLTDGGIDSHAMFFDGVARYATTHASDNLFALNTVAGTRSLKVFITNIDVPRLLENTTGVWTLCESSGSSTSPTTPTAGWTLQLEHDGASALELHFRYHDGTVAQDLVYGSGFQTHWTKISDVFLVEVEVTAAASTNSLGLYKNGSDTVSGSVITDTNASPSIAGNHFLTIGAFLEGNPSNPDHTNFFDGTIGQVVVDDAALPASSKWLGYNRGDVGVQWVWNPDDDTVWETDAYGDETAILAATNPVRMFPFPSVHDPAAAFPAVRIFHRDYAEIDLSEISIDGSRSWGFIIGLNAIGEPPTLATAPPWFVTIDERYFLVMSDGIVWKATSQLGLEDDTTTPSTYDTLSQVTGEITFNFNRRFGVFFESNHSTSPPTTTMRFFHKADDHTTGSWSHVGDDTGNGLPKLNLKILLNTNSGRQRFVPEWTMADFHFFLGNTMPAATAAGIAALDVNTSGKYTTFPEGLLVSYQMNDSSSVKLDSDVIYTGNSESGKRVCSVQDQVNNRRNMEFFPRFGVTSHASMQHLTRAVRPRVYGAHSEVRSAGDLPGRFLNLVAPGGVYRYDQDSDSGEWIQSRMPNGRPTAGTRAIALKSRVFIYGSGFQPFKTAPSGIHRIGIPAPIVGGSTAVDAGTNEGGLTDSTTYEYKLTAYNSFTGEESNADDDPPLFRATGTTPTGDVYKITLTITTFLVNDTNDWDTIRVYRRKSTIPYRLEQEVARPAVMPQDGGSLEISSRLPDDELILRPELELDNAIPDDFVAAVVANDTMHVTGAGKNPGRVHYSKSFGRLETFPPLNVWRLNNDNGDRGRSLFHLLGRVIIIKERSVWSVPDNGAEAFIKPVQVHDKGAAGTNSSVQYGPFIAFLSGDRNIYQTNGFEMSNISKLQIKQTLESFTDAQLRDSQAAHDAQSQKVWWKIGTKQLVYNYDLGRWTVFEVPSDSISSGFEQISGNRLFVGHRGMAYKIDELSQANQESDYSGSQTTFVYEVQDTGSLWLEDGTDLWGLDVGETIQTDLAGMPFIIVTHTTARDSDPASATFYEPLFEVATRTFGAIAGINGQKIYFCEAVTGAASRVTIYIGIQYRRYLSQRLAPQGEGFPYLFQGMSLLNSEDVVSGSDTVLRVRFDDDAAWSFVFTQLGGSRDRSFHIKRRGRSTQHLLENATRGDELEVQKVIHRYRVRTPRRRKY